MNGALVALLAALAAVAYRRLWFWDPGPPGAPDATWFFFGSADTAPRIVLVAAAGLLLWRRRRLAATLADEGELAPALPLLGLSLGLFVWGHHAGADDLLVVSLACGVLGAALWICGRRLARAMLLPLLLLVFAVPMPGVLVNQIAYPLQISTAVVVDHLLALIGQPALREGDLIYISGHTFQVIESCSGLRALQVLTMLAVGWVAVVSVRPLHAVLLVLAAPIIAYGVNVLRVLSLVLYPQSDFAATHSVQGVVMLLVGVALIQGLDALLGRLLPAAPAPTPEAPREAAVDAGLAGRRRLRLGVIGALLLGLCALSTWIEPWAPATPTQAGPLSLPEEMAGWQAGGKLPLDGNYLGSTRFTRHAHRRYQREGESVRVFVGFDDRLKREVSLLSPKNAYDGFGWNAERTYRFELAPGGPDVEAVQARSRSRRVLAYTWYVGTEPAWAEILRAVLALDQSVLRRPGGAFVVRVSTDVGADGVEGAAERLGEVGRAVHAALPELGDDDPRAGADSPVAAPATLLGTG